MANRLLTKFVKPSTINFIQEGLRTPNYSFLDLLHGYAYAKWPYLYLGIGSGKHPYAEKIVSLILALGKIETAYIKVAGLISNGTPRDKKIVPDGYHGKVVPLEPAKHLVQIKEDIRLPDLEHIVPYKLARDIIMQNPDHIAVLECPCRAARPNPCLPLDVCLIIGEPFASFIQEHHPTRARRITQDEAAQILEEEDERGHVHHAFFKDAMFGRFYAICNCCACCCGAMQAHHGGSPMLASSGFLASVDEDLCIGCGTCLETCQFYALSMPNGHALVDEMKCMGCGICVGQCIEGAMHLSPAPEKGTPLEICSLMEDLFLESEKVIA